MRSKWLCAIIIALGLTVLLAGALAEGNQDAFLAKAALLREQVVTDEVIEALGDAPAGDAGYAVLFSVCDGATRAKTYSGAGADLGAAWDAAVERASAAVDVNPLWVKADVVTSAESMDRRKLGMEMGTELEGFFFYGFALDDGFEVAFPEGELNGAGVYDYENTRLSLAALNKCLAVRGLSPLDELPDDYIVFDARGWLCDEDSAVHPLIYSGMDYGRRVVSPLDADFAHDIIDQASAYLVQQVKEDGTFIYGLHPMKDAQLTSYNMLRHSGTIWALICRYRMYPDENLKATVEGAIDYMLSQVIYDEDGAGFMYEKKTDECKLGGNGIAVVALTEYMDVFGTDQYTKACVALGEGILKHQVEDGGYWHVLDGNMVRSEAFRTVYYDGECTFALIRLYELTGEQRWLDAACKAVDHFIAGNYTQYRDHWVAYSLNEITKYVDDRQDYYDFALANAVDNYEEIQYKAHTFPTNLELLLASFESWQRMVDRGVDTGDFDVNDLFKMINERAQHQLSGFFFPEYAMYMANPQRVVGSFMIRDSEFRVRIDDVQHNIGGYYLYWKNYDKMIAAGYNPDWLG